MLEIHTQYTSLDKGMPTIVYCHAGVRSARVVHFLRSVGFADVKNLRGGIDAWSKEIDPNVKRY